MKPETTGPEQSLPPEKHNLLLSKTSAFAGALIVSAGFGLIRAASDMLAPPFIDQMRDKYKKTNKNEE